MEFGLSASHLKILFPFHFVIDRQFKIIQLGPSLGGIFDTDIRLNTYMDHFFELTTPSSLLNWGYLRTIENDICTLRHKKSNIDFSARILPSGPDTLLFLLKPLINTAEYLEQLGLNTADFSNHDLVNDLFLRTKNTNVTKNANIEDVLITQDKQLGEIRRLLATQEAESRKLAHIISRSSYWVIIANKHGHIEWVNTAFTQNSGFSQDEALGNELNLLLNVTSDEFAQIKQTLISHQNFRKELSFGVDNLVKWIDIDIRPLLDDENNILNFIAIGRDITEQKKAQTRSHQLSVELNSIFDLSPDGFVSFDENDELSQVNSAFLVMTGLSVEDLNKITSEQFDLLINDLNQEDSKLGAGLKGSGSIIKIVQPKLTFIRRTLKEVVDIGSKHPRTIHYFQDITHEYELSKMKGEFLSIAAHELRTPMSSIFGFTDLLIRREFSVEQRKEILENIFRQATRMTNLINDLLDLARIEAKGKLTLRSEEITVQGLMDAALDDIKMHAGHRKIQVADYDASLSIKGNFDKLIQVFTNLLSNAHKYSSIEKIIKVDVLERQDAGVSFVGIRIIDEGIGIIRSELDQLFEPFFRAANSQGIPGTGLGMRIVKEIVDLHDGIIEVSSELNVGTQVTVWLPKA